jgi:DNA-directed RNA polymerase alpha subunit
MSIRIHKVARMRVNGVRDNVIQHLLGIQAPAFKYLINLPEYKEVEEQILLGHLTDLDEATAGQVSVLRQQAREAVPSALRCLVEAVNQRRDLRTALAAAGEILDRDPDATFTKQKGLNVIPIDAQRLPDTLMEVTSKEADKVIEDLAQKKERVM